MAALRSSASKNQYNSQTFKLTSNPLDYCIVPRVLIYAKETGDVSAVTAKVYICDGNSDNTKPDFTKVYAEGQIRGTFAHAVEALTFDSGSEEPLIGAQLDEQGGDGSGIVHKVTRYAGTWAGGDAEGVIYMKGVTGTWTDEATININGGTTNIATVNGGDTDPIGTGCYLVCDMDYWDIPQNLYDGSSTPPTIFMAIISDGDTDSNYFSWGYKETTSSYSDGRMYNSDDSTPGDQANCDYTFKICGDMFNHTATIETGTITGDSELTRWDKVFVTLDTNTTGDYTRVSILEKIEYEVEATNANWGTWVETTNGGEISGTGRYLRLKLTFKRPTDGSPRYMDSFTLRSVKSTFLTQTLADTLIDSAVFEDRYWLSCKIVDGKVQPS